MDNGHEPSPRSARTKKKSHLAKLAARKRESDDSASELGSRTSLNDLRRQSFQNRHQSNQNNSYREDSEASDEGISDDCGPSSSGHVRVMDRRAPSDTTIDRFQSMKVNGMEDSDDESEGKGNKRTWEQNSDSDEIRRDGTYHRTKKKSVSHDSDEEAIPSNSNNGGVNLESVQTDESDSDNEPMSNLTRTFKRDDDREQMKEHYKQLLDAPDISNSPKPSRRRSPLSMRKSELDPVEENEMSDEVGDLGNNFNPPKPSTFSPMQSMHLQHNQKILSSDGSMKSYASRPWSATEASEKSTTSTSSALPLITTKEARNR